MHRDLDRVTLVARYKNCWPWHLKLMSPKQIATDAAAFILHVLLLHH